MKRICGLHPFHTIRIKNSIYNDLVILSKDGGWLFNKNTSRTVYNNQAKQHNDRTPIQRDVKYMKFIANC
jgi:hypothetical protein